MEYRRLGRTGMKVSTVSLGSWLTFGGAVEQDTASACVKAAFDAGVNFFDTADVYALGKSETALGAALTPLRRKSYVLATKCFWPTGDGPNDRGLSRKHIIESLDESLARLRTPYVDLMQCHRFDPDADLTETVHAMEDLVRQGKTLYWGVSVWTGDQMREAMRIARTIGGYGPVSNQPQYNMLVREIERDALPAARELGMGTIVWSPMAQGMLTGKYRKGDAPQAGTRAATPGTNKFLLEYMTDANFEAVERLRPIAREVGSTMAQLALAWCLHQPGITSVIAGATKVEQVQDNVKAADLKLSPAILKRIEAAIPGA